MPTLKPSRDIQPAIQFRATAAQFIEQVQSTGEPGESNSCRSGAETLTAVYHRDSSSKPPQVHTTASSLTPAQSYQHLSACRAAERRSERSRDGIDRCS